MKKEPNFCTKICIWKEEKEKVVIEAKFQGRGERINQPGYAPVYSEYIFTDHNRGKCL